MIGGYVGPQGAGKTCLMTLHAFWDWEAGYDVVSNYTLKFGEHACPCHGKHYNTKCEHVADYKTVCGSRVGRLNLKHLLNFSDEVVNMTMAIDEIHIILDSRSAMHKQNQILTWWLLQARKRGVDLLYTTQWWNQVDIRLRHQTDMIFKMKNHGGEIRAWAFIQEEIEEGRPPRKYRIDPHPIFDLFDTREIVNPFEGWDGKSPARKVDAKATDEAAPLKRVPAPAPSVMPTPASAPVPGNGNGHAAEAAAPAPDLSKVMAKRRPRARTPAFKWD